jgi:hypothetical protein
MRSLVLGGLLGLVMAGAAQATPTQDAARSFGLIGVWADDCSQPASRDNEYDTYELSADGSIREMYAWGAGTGTNNYRWTNAQLVGPDRIVMDGVFFGNGLGQHVVMVRQGNRARVLESRDSTGRLLVVNGAFPSGGVSGWQTKCF